MDATCVLLENFRKGREPKNVPHVQISPFAGNVYINIIQLATINAFPEKSLKMLSFLNSVALHFYQCRVPYTVHAFQKPERPFQNAI